MLLMALAAADGQDRFGARVVEQRGDYFATPADGGDFNRSDELIGDENDAEQAAFLFQPPALSQPSPAAPSARRSGQRSNLRLASVPNMLGDLGTTATKVTITDPNAASGGRSFSTSFNMPSPGGVRQIKLAENDRPIPTDRVFFNYNHFQNVFQISETPTNPPGPTVIRHEPIDRFTLGAEKTFLDGWTSVELRIPFNGTFDTQLQSVGINGGNVGNLAVVLKSLLYIDGNLAVGAGTAIDTPTGSDVVTRIGSINLRTQNQSVHLAPYIGFLWSPGDPTWGWGDGLFITGFAQMDVAANGNELVAQQLNGNRIGSLGRLTDQNLGFLDISAGYWLYRDPYAPRWTGMAVITELHYTTTLNDADRLASNNNGVGVAFGSNNRFDVLNGTIGVQALMFDMSSLRVAGVFPIGNEDRRLFDSELQVQFNRRF